ETVRASKESSEESRTSSWTSLTGRPLSSFVTTPRKTAAPLNKDVPKSRGTNPATKISTNERESEKPRRFIRKRESGRNPQYSIRGIYAIQNSTARKILGIRFYLLAQLVRSFVRDAEDKLLPVAEAFTQFKIFIR